MDCKVFVHVSRGSPLKNFSKSSTQADWEWFKMFPCVLKCLKVGNHSSFELPWFHRIWSFDLCQKTLKQAGHKHYTAVKLRKTGMKSSNGKPIGKALCFTSSSVKFVHRLNHLFSKCSCQVHAALSETDYTQTAFYNDELSRAIGLGAQEAWEDV